MFQNFLAYSEKHIYIYNIQVTVDVDGVYSEKCLRLSCPYYGPAVSNGKVCAPMRLSIFHCNRQFALRSCCPCYLLILTAQLAHTCTLVDNHHQFVTNAVTNSDRSLSAFVCSQFCVFCVFCAGVILSVAPVGVRG